MFVRALIVGTIALLLWSVAAAGSGGAGPARTYTVRAHDTLWSIAVAQYAGDPREGMWKLRERNDIVAGVIRPGQRLVIPP